METPKQEESGKVKKKFDAAVKKMQAILGGPKNLIASSKVPGSAIDTLVKDLFKEETEANEKQLKEKIKAAIKGYTDFTKWERTKLQEMAKLKEQEMEKFTKVANDVINQIDGMSELEKSY